jgi:hypothetical protein
MRPITLTLLSALGLACSFDASGVSATSSSGGAGSSTGDPHATGSSSTGDPSPTTGGPTTSGPTSEPDPTTEPVDPGTSSTGPAVTTGPGDTTDGTTTTGAPDTTTTGPDESSSSSESTGPPDTTMAVDPCDGLFVKEIALVEDAVVVAPMEKFMSDMEEALVAISTVAEAGTVTFTIDLECDGVYSLWGRALDLEKGAHPNDPDSFYVQVDGGPESTWVYGCQTEDLVENYNWLRVRAWGNNCMNPVDVTPTLTAGSHTFRFRNREAGNQNEVAALSRIVLTNDPAYVPMLPD